MAPRRSSYERAGLLLLINALCERGVFDGRALIFMRLEISPSSDPILPRLF